MQNKKSEVKKQKDLPTYNQDYHCLNCGHRFPQEFEYGEVAKQGACPLCGVHPSQLQHTTNYKKEYDY